jgi:hypothetical protein
MIEAGYSPTTADKKAHLVVRQPAVQSILTEACQRIMRKRNMAFDEILEPYFDGLKAKVIVKSQQLGDAQEVDLPDHHVRMQAADRLVKLHVAGPSEEAEGRGANVPPVNIQVNFVSARAPGQEPNGPDGRPSDIVTPPLGNLPQARFLKSRDSDHHSR